LPYAYQLFIASGEPSAWSDERLERTLDEALGQVDFQARVVEARGDGVAIAVQAEVPPTDTDLQRIHGALTLGEPSAALPPGVVACAHCGRIDGTHDADFWHPGDVAAVVVVETHAVE
jgi:hypothetical protein